MSLYNSLYRTRSDPKSYQLKLQPNLSIDMFRYSSFNIYFPQECQSHLSLRHLSYILIPVHWYYIIERISSYFFQEFCSFFPENNNNTVVERLEMCKFSFLDCCNRASVDLQVQLGIMFKDENRGEDMVDILRSLHE